MKKYTRKGLIRFFEKMPPRSKPCDDRRCPIMVYVGAPADVGSQYNDAPSRYAELDGLLADKFDDAAIDAVGWETLTAKQIVQIAKSL